MTVIHQAASVSDSVEAALQFVIADGEKPKIYIGSPLDGVPQRSGQFEQRNVTIADGRSIAAQLTLDREGFELRPHQTEVVDFYDDTEVTSRYYAEVEKILKDATGASSVHIFDHTIRVEDDAKRDQYAVRAPVPVVHNDYTLRSGPQRVRDLVDSNTAERYLQHRFAEINVWRSISNQPVQTTPIAVADAQSIRMQDFVASDLVYGDRVGEIYQVAFNPEQRWYYFPRTKRSEVLLLKCYDSASDGRARFSAHSAFKNPTAGADAPPRESIEVRALVSFA